MSSESRVHYPKLTVTKEVDLTSFCARTNCPLVSNITRTPRSGKHLGILLEAWKKVSSGCINAYPQAASFLMPPTSRPNPIALASFRFRSARTASQCVH